MLTLFNANDANRTNYAKIFELSTDNFDKQGNIIFRFNVHWEKE